MNDFTLVISAAERVTTAGGCRSSGANGSLRYTLRGGRASAGSQASATPLSPPVPSSTITITEGEPAVKLRQRTAPRSVVSVPLASASHCVKRAVPPATLHRAGGLHDHATDRVARLIVHDIGAIDGPAERAVARVDRGAEAAVADERALAPPGRQTVPDEVLAREKGGPIDCRCRPRRRSRLRPRDRAHQGERDRRDPAWCAHRVTVADRTSRPSLRSV